MSNLRIWKDVDTDSQAITAWRTHLQWMAPERHIWMDGRPHPPDYVAHTWQGFSTGEWRGDMLTVTMTHLKAAHVRRNGVPRSDQATLTEYFVRHGAVLTWVSIVHDPVYLTEPFMRTRNFALSARPSGGGLSLCVGAVEIAGLAPGYIPHHLPGENPYLTEFSDYYGVGEAARGGAETMYPEYRFTVTGTGPAVCARYCRCIGIQGAACPLEGTGF